MFDRFLNTPNNCYERKNFHFQIFAYFFARKYKFLSLKFRQGAQKQYAFYLFFICLFIEKKTIVFFEMKKCNKLKEILRNIYSQM